MTHTCSYYCDKPECIRSQRDFLRDLAEKNASPAHTDHPLRHFDRTCEACVSEVAPTPRTDAPHCQAAFINAIAEEGTKQEAIAWLQQIWNERCQLERELAAARSKVDAIYDHLADESDISPTRVFAKSNVRR